MATLRTASEIERVLAHTDPELLEAADEIDASLLHWSLGLTPLERLRACTRMAGTLERLRRGFVSQ